MIFIEIFSKVVHRNYLIIIPISRVYNNCIVESRSIRDIVTTFCHVLWTDLAKYICWPQNSRTKRRARIFVTARTTRLSHSLNSSPHPNIWQLICILPTISPCRRRNAFDLCQHSWNSKTGHAACYCIMHLLCDLKNFLLDKSNPVGRFLDTRVF